MSPSTRKRFRWGTILPTGRKRYTDPETGLRIKRTNRKCRIPIDLYPCRVKEKLIMIKVEGKWIMKKEMRMISKDGTISKFPKYTSSKKEEEEEEEEEEKKESKKNRSKEVSEMGSNSEPPGYAAIDNKVESDLESTARSEPKCKEMKDTCGAVALTRWIEKMEPVIDNSGCAKNQKVKYADISFINKALTWWNTQVQEKGREDAI
nr:reverse transcriptase domain-containing protein [Tanacetum cinerariifolium]